MTGPEFELTFPEQEAAVLRQRYRQARVILEYGSGGSTLLAAQMPGKYIMSVESDATWARRLQDKIDASALPSSAVVWHCDIGPTGAWGRPVDETSWRRFHHYPTRIWYEPFFRDPDTVLIDGRFRSATFVSVFLRIRKPGTVLFDDYGGRPAYHAVERLASPVARHGRMAEFHIEPGPRAIWMQDLFSDLMAQATCARDARISYNGTGWDEAGFRKDRP